MLLFSSTTKELREQHGRQVGWTVVLVIETLLLFTKWSNQNLKV